MLRTRIFAIGLGVVSCLFMGTLPLAAQQPPAATSSSKPETPAAKPTPSSSRRVPAYFGQIGLSPEQKDAIYQVVAKHQTRIEELKKELAEANDKMVEECETLLDDAQKKSLESRRRSAADAAKARAAARGSKAKDVKKSD